MKKNVLIFDLNNLLWRMLFLKDVGIHSEFPSLSLWHFLVYEAVYNLLIRTKNVHEVVLAVDDKVSWRRSYFPRYKEHRKKDREKQDLDWEYIFRLMNKFIGDLKHHMPFKTIKIRSAEADDIIAVITNNIDEDVIICSNDEDYLQLSSERVKVWNPSHAKFMECDDPETFLQKKCLEGQKKDNIFNVKTPTNWGLTPDTDGKRKPGLGSVMSSKIIKEGLDKWLDENNLRDNYKRNRNLIDFSRIPVTIQNRILRAYDDYNFPPPENIYPFFKKYQMKSYMEDFHMVESVLRKLY